MNSKSGLLKLKGAELNFEIAGKGREVVLIHAGVADSRMWDGVFETLAKKNRVLRYDLRGYGKSSLTGGPFAHHEDLHALIMHHALEKPVIVGVSYGAKISIDFALTYPELCGGLVLVSPVVGGWSFSSEIRTFGSAEDEFLELGDVEGATELNLKFWLAGPQRSLSQMNADLVEQVRVMQRNAFQIQLASKEAVAQGIEPPAIKRLSEIAMPTLIMTGDQDVSDVLAIAAQLKNAIRGAKHIQRAGEGHLLSMEGPGKFLSDIRTFLDQNPLD
jgi:pimeloyl-ACP methyl ester carboxylesterase